jgi:hypothetical protein
MDSVVHFEIPADDIKRASSFYKKAFGWSAEEMQGMEYWMLGTTEVNEQGMAKNPGAINGGMGKREAPLKGIVVTINVKDIDKSLDKIEKLGGKTVQKKQPVGSMGFTAYFKDSEGNIVGLYQNAT